MSAELLRRAAAKLRETADPVAHFGTGWTVWPDEGGSWLVGYGSDRPEPGLIARTPDYGRMYLADWIALMHPGLAEPLAALLEEAAERDEYFTGHLTPEQAANQISTIDEELAVARAILGEAADA